ncbi:MAG: APC family permease [Gemmatimonadales bacterium]
MSNREPGTVVPRRVLSTLDGVILVVGLVLGAGIFRAPQMVAAGTPSDSIFLLLWVLGGLVSLIGALCYAELAATYPNAGGEYHFLTRAFGRTAGFLCAWSRMAVIQTGSIAFLGFLVGDYTAALFDGEHLAWMPAAVAAVVVVILTVVNLAGLRQGTGAQYALTTVEVLGLCAIIVAGFLGPAAGAPAAPSSDGGGGPGIGLAAVFVLLTFGGWSEAAYLSAELRDRRRGVIHTLAWGLGILTVLYLLANAAYLRALGHAGVAASEAVGADVMRQAVGGVGAVAVSLIVIVSALSSANATMITGARCNYALGRDIPLFGFLGGWHEEGITPKAAFLLQSAVALGLVGFGALARNGFEAMVAYTAPVFWMILLGTGASVIVLRRRDPGTERPFRVPLYPLTPLLFCGFAGYMLYSSLAYAGRGALLGLAVMLAGLPLLAIARSRQTSPAPSPPTVSRGAPWAP